MQDLEKIVKRQQEQIRSLVNVIKALKEDNEKFQIINGYWACPISNCLKINQNSETKCTSCNTTKRKQLLSVYLNMNDSPQIMKRTKCPYCEFEIADGEDTCSICGGDAYE